MALVCGWSWLISSFGPFSGPFLRSVISTFPLSGRFGCVSARWSSALRRSLACTLLPAWSSCSPSSGCSSPSGYTKTPRYPPRVSAYLYCYSVLIQRGLLGVPSLLSEFVLLPARVLASSLLLEDASLDCIDPPLAFLFDPAGEVLILLQLLPLECF